MWRERHGIFVCEYGPLVAVLLAIAIPLSIAVAGCLGDAASPTPRPIRSDPDFIAFIVEVERSKDRDLQGVIVAESHADKIVSRYLVRILDDTAIFDKAGESYRPARFRAFAEKQWVWIWFTAPAPDDFGATVDALQVAIILD